jgi:hypothetical protein
MATFSSVQASEGRAFAPLVSDPGVVTAYGEITIAANPADGDIYELVRVPRGATVIGGYLMADDIDTNANETLDMDIGWAGNGVDAADPDGFGNLGVWTGDAITGIKPEVGNYFVLGGVLFTTGPKTFAKETVIQVEANAAAATFAAGKMWVVVHYVL